MRLFATLLTRDSASPEPSVEWAIDEEHVKAVAFNRSGDRLIAVCDWTWTQWNMQDDFSFQKSLTGDHQFVGHYCDFCCSS